MGDHPGLRIRTSELEIVLQGGRREGTLDRAELSLSRAVFKLPSLADTGLQTQMLETKASPGSGH